MNYDKLTIDLETDGSISAPDAIAKAAAILIGCFENFRQLASSPIPVSQPEETAAEENAVTWDGADPVDLSQVPIDELDLSVRAFNCLKRAEINMIAQLTDKTEDELTRVRNLGKKSVDEIKIKLEQYKGLGLHLKEPKD